MKKKHLNETALEKSAKYICSIKCGRCPAVEELSPCPTTCGLNIPAWQCRLIYFKHNNPAGKKNE